MNQRTIAACLFCLVLVFALSGCGATPRYWYSPQKDALAIKKDLFQCEEDAASFSRNMGEAGNKDIFQKRLQDCMTLHGYQSLTERDLPKGAPKVR